MGEESAKWLLVISYWLVVAQTRENVLFMEKHHTVSAVSHAVQPLKTKTMPEMLGQRFLIADVGTAMPGLKFSSVLAFQNCQAP